MATEPAADEPAVVYLDEDDALAFFDRAARDLMGMSGEEFLRRWDAGEFDEAASDCTNFRLGDLIMLMPFAGRDPR